MTQNTSDLDIAKVRLLLMRAFTPDELRRFCLDRPAFRPVADRFGPDFGLDDMVDEVIEYCRVQFLWDELLAEVKQANPRQYARFEPDLYAPAPAQPRPALAAKPRPPAARSIPWQWILGGLLVVLIILMAGTLWQLATPDDPATTATYVPKPSLTFTRRPLPTDTPAPTSTYTPQPTPDVLRVAERMAADWYAALRDGDVESLVELASLPFYMDQDPILVSIDDIRAEYTEMVQRLAEYSPSDWETGPVSLSRIEVGLVSDFRETGYVSDNDRVTSRLHIVDDDVAAALILKGGEGLIMFFRRSGADLEMAGFWD